MQGAGHAPGVQVRSGVKALLPLVVFERYNGVSEVPPTAQSEEWERGFGPASGGGTTAARAESIEVPSLYHHYITQVGMYSTCT